MLIHYQAELITDTIAAMETLEQNSLGIKYFLDVFSIRQGVPQDFQLEYVEKLIAKIGLTLMVAEPWQKPDTIQRIWCVF